MTAGHHLSHLSPYVNDGTRKFQYFIEESDQLCTDASITNADTQKRYLGQYLRRNALDLYDSLLHEKRETPLTYDTLMKELTIFLTITP